VGVGATTSDSELPRPYGVSQLGQIQSGSARASNQFGVPKGTRTYVDAKNLRNNRDCGLRLPLADGGFNAG